MTLTLLKRQQRSAGLCCHCLRNVAYYRAWWENGQPHRARDYVVNTNGNFIDIAVLEWCKLFTSPKKEKYHFKHVVADADAFSAAMIAHIGVTKQQWDDYINTMKKYRDKYIAHWDDDSDGFLRPALDIAINSTAYLLDYLNDHAEDGRWPFPPDAAQFYEERRAHAVGCF